MITLGVDPGTHKMGVGLIRSENGDLSFIHAEVVSAASSRPLPARLHHMYQKLIDVIDRYRPDVIAIEDPFVSKNAKAALAVGQAQAVAMLAGAGAGLDISTYAPRTVKQSVTDYGGSSKEQVQEMVRVLLGLSSPPEPYDATDALAAAICHVNAYRASNLESYQ